MAPTLNLQNKEVWLLFLVFSTVLFLFYKYIFFKNHWTNVIHLFKKIAQRTLVLYYALVT